MSDDCHASTRSFAIASKHLIIGLRGKMLTHEERRWLREHPPMGVILFTRNIENQEQVRLLLADVRVCTGEATWAVIDEEGGRVNRIPWAPFSNRRPATEYGQLMRHDPEAAKQAVYTDSLSTGRALKALGFTHNCAPVLDVFHPHGHGIVGERAYAGDADMVGELGKVCMQGLSDAGVEAVGKHFPGHGRANADSHIVIPEVNVPLDTLLAEAQPFHTLIDNGIEHMMTAHVIYRSTEQRVATLSAFWLKDVLRQQFGFTGDIWSDDLCMAGAGNDIRDTANKALNAGCDMLLVCDPEGVAELLA